MPPENDFLSKNFQAVGHFNAEVYAKSLSVADKPYQEIILAKVMQMHAWASLYLRSPHQDLGRVGPVCPFVPLAIKKNTFLITHHLCYPDTTIDDIQALMRDYKVHFQALAKAHYPINDKYCSFMIVFVSATHDATYLIDLIQRVQTELKPHFIKDNTMIGQFFDGCDVQGIHNKAFKPFDAPVPTLAIRTLMPQDLVFVTDTAENMRLYRETFEIHNKSSIMALLKSVCLDKNKNVLLHADLLIKNITTSGSYEPMRH